ncbi:MAG: SLATT domain-containing protein [Planctomycetes bacterium]|nr:SLATT domain-containing protein [Planctomycetota bacterium]
MKDVYDLAMKFWRRAGGTGIAHYRAAETAQKRHRQIGIPNVVITAIVATSIFSTLSENDKLFWIRITTGIIALATAVLAALQAFLKFGDRAEKHMIAGAKYTNIRRNIDIFFLEFSVEDGAERTAAIKELKDIADKLSTLDADSPTLTDVQFKRGRDYFDSINPRQPEKLPAKSKV